MGTAQTLALCPRGMRAFTWIWQPV
uniref:Uncharacterized protein n=1 Tax=Anguilla anguilla TaxID=7936 RepID=A0A0E9T442_ANGAN